MSSDNDKTREFESDEAEPESVSDAVDEASAEPEPVGDAVDETSAEPEPVSDAVDETSSQPDVEAGDNIDDFVADTIETDDSTSESSDDAPAAQVSAKARGNGIAWVALLFSLIAVAAIGYTVSQDWLADADTTTDDAIARLEGRLASATESRDELAARITELGALDESSDSAIDEQIDALRVELDERVRLLSSLPARMSTLESSVASLAGISESSRDAWLIAEAEYYMQIANAQLQLANNPELATLALRMADERVVQMGNPALTDVRRAISNELASLDVMEKPDIAGATMTLASLAQVVDSLPLASEARTTDEAAQTADEDQSGLNRAWSSMKQAMSGLVRVTPPDQAKLALISPDAEVFLRNNLALQLQTARLALLRGEQAVFEQTLDDTGALLTQYFDRNSAQVASAQETLAEIRSNVFTSSAPDISGSLQLLRQFRVLRESSQ
ncbi:MAG: uroporphyrinogen-III C-methyltransferase [Woeseiaceae bacterium]